MRPRFLWEELALVTALLLGAFGVFVKYRSDRELRQKAAMVDQLAQDSSDIMGRDPSFRAVRMKAAKVENCSWTEMGYDRDSTFFVVKCAPLKEKAVDSLVRHGGI